MRRLIFPLLLGLAGACVLVGLGVWQLQRLELKNAAIAKIDAKLVATAAPLPTTIDAATDIYLPVTVTGRVLGPEAFVLTSLADLGPGYRVIVAFQTAGDARKIMVDLGYVAEADREFARPTTDLTLTGNLNWPKETDSFTPEPDLLAKVWFARDVERMANILGTEQVLVVARTIDPGIPDLMPLPVDPGSIPNDHLNYAITWFSLAVVWLGMTVLLVWRIRRRTV